MDAAVFAREPTGDAMKMNENIRRDDKENFTVVAVIARLV
jgi:hypothetical protein